MDPLARKKHRFADFELDATKRLLLKAGTPMQLTSKTLDLLEALVERHGEVVSKDELLTAIWPGQFVEESNLTVQISTLRRALGETRGENRYIVTVPGKGYKFVGEITDGTSAEITIERHRFSTIIVDEEIDEARGQFERRRSDDSQLLLPAGKGWLRRHFLSLGLATLFILTIGIGGAVILWQRQAIAAAPFANVQIRQLTNKGNVRLAALSPDGKVFAYVTYDLGRQSLWLGQIDSGNDIELRPPRESLYGNIDFSPDSSRIYYSVLDDANPKWTIYRLPAFGGVAEKVREDVSGFALAPDGNRLAYFRRDKSEKNTELVLSDLSGTTANVLATLPGTVTYGYGALSFSPDGQTIAFGGAYSEIDTSAVVYVAQLGTGEVRIVTNKHFGIINLSSWLPDGSGLVITAYDTESRAAVPQYQLWFIGLPGGEVRKITSDLSIYHDALGLAKNKLLTIEHRQLNNIWVAPADNNGAAKQITNGSFGKYDGYWGLDWLPDGRIVFDSSDQVSQAISIMDADGRNRRQLTAPGNVDSALDASPDGRYIIFHSTRGGGSDIWRIDADGSNAKQLTFSQQCYQPFVSADSRYVYYKSWQDGIGEMRRVPIDGGESVALTDKETSWVAASPDGRFIAASYRTDKRRLAIFGSDGGAPIKQFDLPKTGTLYGGARWTPDNASVVYGDAAYGYWQQTINGGEPKRIENLPKEKLYNFAWSRDGKQFAFVRGIDLRDVVLITDSK